MEDLQKSSETSLPSLTTLRHALARCCKILGLTQENCLNLTLLMQSRAELATLLCWMLEEEEKGNKPTRTEVMIYAAKIKDYTTAHPEILKEYED